MKLSVIIPVFNEKNTIREIINRVKNVDLDTEIIVVDDFSSDGTTEKLQKIGGIKTLYRDVNGGKGISIRDGLREVSGDWVVIQDADFEYNPEDFLRLIKKLKREDCDIVYGSRFRGGGEFSILSFLANKFLTLLANFLYNSRLTDIETCYKCIKTDIIKTFDLQSERFEFEVEITAKLLREGYDIKEVPVSYKGRRKGKKVTFKDGLIAIRNLFKFRFSEG